MDIPVISLHQIAIAAYDDDEDHEPMITYLTIYIYNYIYIYISNYYVAWNIMSLTMNINII